MNRNRRRIGSSGRLHNAHYVIEGFFRIRIPFKSGGVKKIHSLKKFKKAWNAVTTVIVALVVAIAVLPVGLRVFGLQTYTVLSGSMEPAYPTGSLLYVKKTAPEEVEVGQPITFVMNEDLLVATHRVVEIDTENQRFYTKGDANDAVDGSPVHFSNLVGVPVFSIPYLGYVVNYIQKPPGLYAALAAGALLLNPAATVLQDVFRYTADTQQTSKRLITAASDKSGGGKRHRRIPYTGPGLLLAMEEPRFA